MFFLSLSLSLSLSPTAACGQKILDNLARIYQMERRVKDEEERDSANSTPVHRPTSASLERSDSASSETRRRHSANKLQRQDESVREGECRGRDVRGRKERGVEGEI